MRAPPHTAIPPSRTSLIAAFATIYLVWGSTYLAIRIAVETMPPFLMAAVRFIIAGAALLAFARLRGAPRPTPAQWRANAVIGTLLLLGGNGLVVWAEQFIPSGIAALVIGVTPLCIVLTEWAWPGGIRPTAGTLFALLLGFGGVAWLAAPWEDAAAGGFHAGALVALLGATVFWSIGAIYSRHSKHGADPVLASALQMLGGGCAILLVSAGLGEPATVNLGAVSARSWISFVYLIIFGSIVGFSTFVWLMRHAPPARVATYAYVNPIVAVFLGWAVLGEEITLRTFVAAAIIVAAVVIITVQGQREKAG